MCTRAQGQFAHAATPGAPTIAVAQAKAVRYKNACASEPENVCTLLAASPTKSACLHSDVGRRLRQIGQLKTPHAFPQSHHAHQPPTRAVVGVGGVLKVAANNPAKLNASCHFSKKRCMDAVVSAHGVTAPKCMLLGLNRLLIQKKQGVIGITSQKLDDPLLSLHTGAGPIRACYNAGCANHRRHASQGGALRKYLRE